VAMASAGLLLSAASLAADDPPFQTNPGGQKPTPPAEPPAFTEDPGKPPAPSAPPAPSITPIFGDDAPPAAPPPAAQPPVAPAPSPIAAPSPSPGNAQGSVSGPVVMPSLKPIESTTSPEPTTTVKPGRQAQGRAAPTRATPVPRTARPAPGPKRPVAAEKDTPRRGKKRQGVRRDPFGPVATFPGFRIMEGGSSRVFVRISSKVEVTEHRGQGQIVYRLRGAGVPSRTNRLPLDTSFFATPVSQVRLVPQGEDADLVIELRQASDARFRVEEQRDGVVLVVDFPMAAGGIAAPGASLSPAPEPATRSTRTRRIGSGSGPDL
jgi:hypothetical protein